MNSTAAVLLTALGFGLIMLFALSLCRVASNADDESEACYNELLREQARLKALEETEGAPLSDLVHKGPPPATEFPRRAGLRVVSG